MQSSLTGRNRLPHEPEAPPTGRASRPRPRPRRAHPATVALILAAAALSAMAVPGCVPGPGESEEWDDSEDVSEAEEAITLGVNLAQGKSATQSTEYTPFPGPASRAVDGNTEGSYFNLSTTHTAAETSPWWQVDLGPTPQPVGVVEIWNRADCCADRLSNFKVLVSDDGASWQSWDYPGVAGRRAAIAVNRTARYVKIQLNSTGAADRYLSLAEVKVFAATNAPPDGGAPGAGTLTPTMPRGRLPGTFDVDSEGAATYSIPLQVPPGFEGAEPTLSLAYRSTNPNTLAGVGWALRGIPSITRCPRTMAIDGVRGSIEANSDDRYCLEGQRLIALNGGIDGGAGTEYRTEVDTYSNVMSGGDCDSGACFFKVIDKSGTVMIFGGTPESRVALSGGTRAWGMSSLTTRHGNTVAVSYLQESGLLYPSQIVYGTNPAVPSLKKRKVTMTYETRPDSERTYFGGGAIVLAKRLASVKTFVESPSGADLPVRDYRLTYITSAFTGRSLVSSVRECDGQGVCLPESSFLYNSLAPDWTAPSEIANPPGDAYQGAMKFDPGAFLQVADVNGDGKSDFLRWEHDNWNIDGNGNQNFQVYLSSGDGTFQIVTPHATDPKGYYTDLIQHGFGRGYNLAYGLLGGAHPVTGDWNGDGKADFMRIEDTDTANVSFDPRDSDTFYSAGDGTFTTFDWWRPMLQSDWGWSVHPGDFDGDGKTDFLRQSFGDATDNARVYVSQGSTGFKRADGAVADIAGVNPYDAWVFDWGLHGSDGAIVVTGDMDGDGRTDILRQERDDWASSGSTENLMVLLARGVLPGSVWHYEDRFLFKKVVPHVYVNGEDQPQALSNGDYVSFLPGDFNGDGKTDFIRQERGLSDNDSALNFQIYFSRGNGTFEIITPEGDEYQNKLRGDNANLIVLDFNGDGKADFLRQEKDNSPDLLTPSGDGSFSIYLSRGNGLFDVKIPTSTSPWGYQASMDGRYANLYPGDFNGDGKADFIRQEKGSWDDNAVDTFQVFFTKGDRNPDSLKYVGTGLGGEIRVDYKPLTDPTVHTAVAPVSGNRVPARFPRYVVSSYKTTNGYSPDVDVALTYKGGLVDRDGRGFVGFSEIQRTTPAAGTVTTTTFSQDFPTIGAVLSRKTSNLAGAAYVLVENEYGTGDPASRVRAVTLTKETTTRTEGGATLRTVKEIQYDAFANPVIVRDRGLDGDPSDDVATCTQFSNDTVNWRLDYPMFTRVGASCTLDAAGACNCTGVLDWVDRYYDWSTMNVTSVYQRDDRYSAWVSVELTYDALGNVLTRGLPGKTARIVEKNTWDPAYGNQLIARTTSSGALSQTSTFAYDARFGVLVAETDPNGNTSTVQLDGLGRVAGRGRTGPDGSVVQVENVVWGHDQNGSYRETRKRDGWATAGYRWEREYIEEDGRLRQACVHSTPDLSNPKITVCVERRYHPSGEVAKESLPFHYSWTTPTWQETERDHLGRVTKSTDPAGSVTRTVYEVVAPAAAPCPGCQVKITTEEADGTAIERSSVRYEDATGRVRRRVDAIGHAVNYDYDLLGRRTRVGDESGTVQTVYDSLGRVTSVSSLDRGTVTNHYGTGHWLLSTTNANGVVTSYQYDDFGRVTQKSVAGGDTTQYSYDAPAYANSIGRLTEAKVIANGQSSPRSIDRFSYVADGSIATHYIKIDSHEYTLTSAYDPQGRLRSLTYPDGAVLTRTYGGHGALIGLAVNGVPYATYDDFTASGQPGVVTFGNQTQSVYTYDAARRLSTAVTTGPNSAKLMDDQYTWDALQQITAITDRLPGGARTQTFGYGPAGALLHATGLYGEITYEFDAWGNLAKKQGDTFYHATKYDPAIQDYRVIHQVAGGVVSGGALSATYDNAGNRTSATIGAISRGYQYDGDNRLTKVTRGGATVEQYAYDFAGERVKKEETSSDGLRTTFYVTPAFEVTYLPNGHRLETKYVEGPAGRVAAITNDFASGGQAMLDLRDIDASRALYDTRTIPGLAGYVYTRLRAVASHPSAPASVSMAGLVAATLLAIGLLRRRAPREAAAAWRALRGVVLPRRTTFVERHPVFAAIVPIVAAAFLSACTNVPGDDRAAESADALSAGANGYGYPVAGTYYFHLNHIGSSSVVTGSTGLEIARADYKPYGELVDGVFNGVVASPGQDVFRSKFAGKEWDREGQLYYFNARYYDPLTSRFMTADTQVEGAAPHIAAAINPYAYAVDSPVVYTDPSGRLAGLIILAIVIGIAAGAYGGGAAASGQANPGRWDASSPQLWMGLFIGGIMGAASAVVPVAIGGAAGTLAGVTASTLTTQGLRFFAGDQTWESFGKGVAQDIVTGFAAGRLGGSARLPGTPSARIAARAAQKITVKEVGKLAGKTALKVGGVIGGPYLGPMLLGTSQPGASNLHQRSAGSEVASRSDASAPPERVDESPATAALAAHADGILGASGADALPGRTMRDLRSRRLEGSPMAQVQSLSGR